MTEITKERVDRVLINAFASSARLQASDPMAARNISLSLGFEHTPITREQVAANLGEAVAEKWEAIAQAVSDYNKAVWG